MMHKEKIFLRNENNVPTFEKSLSICLEAGGFSFSVTDKKRVLHTIGVVECMFSDSLSEIISGVKQIFTSLNVPMSGYASAELIIPTQKQVWIPKHLFMEGKEKEYLESVCTIDVGEGCYSHYSEEIEAYSVFAANNSLISGLKIAIPSVKVKNQFVKMLDFPCLKSNRQGISLAAFVRDEEIDIAVFDSGKFVFNNTFVYSEQKDLIYFVLNVAKQLKFEENKATVYLAGNIMESTFAEFREFFANVKLEKVDNLRFEDDKFKTVARHKYALILV